jgi:hypothetical protein
MTVNDDDRDRPAQPELDALLDVLRQPARPDELTGEQAAVAAMAAALASSHQEGLSPVPVTKHTRKLAAVGVAAALILGGVTAAAASVLSGSSNDNRVEIPSQPGSSTTSTSMETTTSSSVPETTSSSSSVPETATTAVTDNTTNSTDDDTTDSTDDTTNSTVEDDTATTIDCPDGVQNHGDFVSDVARDTASGPGHGEAVSAAARSDCGKDSTSTSAPDPGTTATTDDNGGDEDHSGPGRGDDHAATTTATTDDHGGNSNSGPGGGEDNSGPGRSDSSGHDGSGHD